MRLHPQIFPKEHAGAWHIAQASDISRTDKIACDGRWYQRAMAKLLDAEKTLQTPEDSLEQSIYIDAISVQYIFRKAASGKSSHLVVAFSAFSALGSKYPHAYNYLNAMSQMPEVDQLFILDSCGSRGCYYIGRDLNHKVEQSVTGLIRKICEENHIPWENVILGGSSKGGSAALYFGLKYQPGCVAAGAPQFYIADYAKEWTPETLEYLTGNDPQKEQELNELIHKQISRPVPTALHVLTSRNDWQYCHIMPLREALTQASVQADIEIEDRIKNHGDIANHYPLFLQHCILKTVHHYVLRSLCCSLASRSFSVHIDGAIETDAGAFTWRITLKNGAETVVSTEISAGEWRYEIPANGDYTAELELIYAGSIIYRYHSETMQTDAAFL